MALGDCYTVPCTTPLDWESVLLGLFARDANGCVALKLYPEAIGRAEDANPCSTQFTLQQLIERSIVEDGCDGYALHVFAITEPTITCLDCGVHYDTEELLKGLFYDDGNCFGIKTYSGPVSCDSVDSYNTCGTQMTFDQLIRSCIVNTEYGLALVLNVLEEDCEKIDCDVRLTNDQLFAGLINAVSGECYGAFNLNGVGITCDNTESIEDCGDYVTLNEAFFDALTPVDCGYALNYILLSAPQ